MSCSFLSIDIFDKEVYLMRIEYDALGESLLDDAVYYGIQTQRAKENFDISNKTISDIPYFVSSIAQIKKAAAIANYNVGALEEPIYKAICQAADEVIVNPDAASFCIDVYQGGGGTSANMNLNEELANRANEILTDHKGYDTVHPNTHVNMGQSTNDVIPSAMKLTVYQTLEVLEQRLIDFTVSLKRKEHEFNEVVKLGRTCFQDALPITLGQQFSGYRSAFERMIVDVRNVRKLCLELPLSATAVGTEFGTFKGYKENLYASLQQVTGLDVVVEDNLFDGLQNADIWVKVSAVTKAVALNLNKLSSDLRIMSSGPRAGLGEIRLPAVQPGSSIMPGKVNPVMPEMAMQVYFRVLGNDVSVTRACEGELDLNVWEMLILNCVTESCGLLSRCLPLLAEKCIDGIQVNQEKCLQDAEQSIALSTVIATLFDYQTASKIAKQAELENKTIKEVVVESGIMSQEEAETFLNPLMMTSPERFNTFFNTKWKNRE
ncbi:aspartate ammonia-lyase [Cocleimonas sp. KMM 6892]|uniref:aspartate ammonia-lyase n=1 Tax=unclassified Cocleimonas TaxID=2639732 RepID=UPI002DBC0A7B|nr:MULTISPECIES: aspartate ammonia-lyase [unclassified Cocleimonas]MEB8433404.1 aspartate ammonia-lyase [Cocleimonas sp. KMM 6892]MEC4716215.1 aspartate ammonia-lyase [Cocleimonas sp. KMM 6895]MEC4745892.1 aspartate ammonia-lyase [Cocleimonas sp. KMM 6896]